MFTVAFRQERFLNEEDMAEHVVLSYIAQCLNLAYEGYKKYTLVKTKARVFKFVSFGPFWHNISMICLIFILGVIFGHFDPSREIP